MNLRRSLVATTILVALSGSSALADCQIADAKLEEAILKKPELRGPANRQMVRDLRSLRDAAFTLWSYGRHDECERLLSNIRELVAAPSMAAVEAVPTRTPPGSPALDRSTICRAAARKV